MTKTEANKVSNYLLLAATKLKHLFEDWDDLPEDIRNERIQQAQILVSFSKTMLDAEYE